MTAPKVTMEDLEDDIVSEHYFTAADGAEFNFDRPCAAHQTLTPSSLSALRCLTFCVLVLKNGFTVVGQSACVSTANFDAAMGRQIARQKAVDQLWPLLGFRLADTLRL